MRHSLVFSAAETVAFQNAASQTGALIPVKSLHVVVAWLNPKGDFEYRGNQVAELHGSWKCKAIATVPYGTSTPYRVVEPVCPKTGLPRAEELRTAWLAGHSASAGGKSRQSRPEETRFTAYVSEVTLIRVQKLTAEQLMQCGVRGTEGGWSYGDSGVLFPTAQLAFADHWNAHFPDMPWDLNPWAWALQLDNAVVHVGEKESLRTARRLLKKFEKERLRLEKMEQAARALRNSQRKTEERICRMLRTHCADSKLQIDGYVAHFDMAFLSTRKKIAVPEEPKENP